MKISGPMAYPQYNYIFISLTVIIIVYYKVYIYKHKPFLFFWENYKLHKPFLHTTLL
jgi:hypothetical protein